MISFPFTNLNGSKLRPAIVLIETNLDVTVCFITSQIDWKEAADISINPSDENGLKKQSLIRTSKIATLDKNLVRGLLGKLSKDELFKLNFNLKILFKL